MSSPNQNPQQGPSQREKSPQNPILWGVLLLALGWLIGQIPQSTSNVQERSLQATVVSNAKALRAKARLKNQRRNKVNQYLRDMEEKVQISSFEVEKENYYQDSQYEGDVFAGYDERGQAELGVDMDQDNRAEQISRQLAQASVEDNQDPEEAIYGRMIQRQLREDHDGKFNDEYIKAFVENAKQAGYKVVIDKDLRVRSVQKIRKYEQVAPK